MYSLMTEKTNNLDIIKINSKKSKVWSKNIIYNIIVKTFFSIFFIAIIISKHFF